MLMFALFFIVYFVKLLVGSGFLSFSKLKLFFYNELQFVALLFISPELCFHELEAFLEDLVYDTPPLF